MIPNANPPDPRILEIGNPTDQQRLDLETWIQEGSASRAAKRLGKNKSNIIFSRRMVEKKAAKAGWTPAADNSKFVAEGYHIKGVSSFTDGQGNVIRQWVKTDQTKEEMEEALRAFIESLVSGIDPIKSIPKKKSGEVEKGLMSGIFIGDSHFGMYASKDETKYEDYDSDIASEKMREAIDNLVERSPNAEIGLLVDVGDYIHMNTSHNQTFKGTPVDVDTRFSRVLRKAGQAMRHAILRMLEKFPKVIVVIAKGNHNPDVAVCIQQIISAYFHDHDRVTVLKTDSEYHFIEWGKWLIGINHGDKIKAEQLPGVMATLMPKAWGRAKSRMWAVGHFHHQDVKELNGCLVQKFAALPPPDAWHSSSGYFTSQAMQMIVFKDDGTRHSTLIYEVPAPDNEPDVIII